MNTLVQSSVFSEWLRDFKDNQGKAQIKQMARDVKGTT
jgi:putative component of toxin-antitoxin plasmid stabilization module